MKRTLWLFLVCVLFVIGCAPAQSVALPDEMPTPSNTPTLIPARTSVVSNEEVDMGGISSNPSNTPIPSTIVPTFTITPTSTPQPPLTEHEWSPETILISMRESMGDGGMALGDLGPPPFILYANGSLFITQTIVVNENYQTRVLIKNLTKNEVCQHLNTFDQIGFLDYDPSNYTFVGDKPIITGAPSTFIEVNAWKSKSDWYSGLSSYMEKRIIREYYGQKGYPIISPALRNTYYFLYQYPTDGFVVYEPDRLAVWLLSVEKKFLDTYGIQVKNWEFKKIPLTQLINKAELSPDREDLRSIILSGQDAQLLYDYFGNLIGSDYFFTEDPKGEKNYYQVFVRPLLPYEMPGDYYTGYMSILPVPDAPKPNFKLTCHPADSVLSIPTP